MNNPDPADTVIEPSRAANEVERVIEDFIAGEVGYMHPLMGEQAERLRIKLADAGLLADPADRDYWRELVRHAEASESWERNQKERAEAEVAELRQKLSDCELLLTDLGKTHTRVSGERDELRATVEKVREFTTEGNLPRHERTHRG